uniref:Uncharacterized protein n=1 Tax=Sinocyclocheilus rhinocerous TaxID=307959 RepID=A0A673LAF0_9TELE
MACTLVLPCAEKTENIIIIARACQQEGMLFIHVVMADFKTLADVLVQEVIKHDIGKQVIGAWLWTAIAGRVGRSLSVLSG